MKTYRSVDTEENQRNSPIKIKGKECPGAKPKINQQAVRKEKLRA